MDDPSLQVLEDDLELYLCQRILQEFGQAKEYMRDAHDEYRDNWKAYHASSEYQNLRKKHKFSMPLMQEICDQFVSIVLDKFWFTNKPVTIVPVEDSDKPDAQAKQDLMDWQDYKDGMAAKGELFVRDMFLSPFCCAQVDYVEDTKKVASEETVDVPVPELQTAYRAAMGQPIPTRTETTTTTKEVVTYKGPRVKRVDPLNVFWGPDKQGANDEHSIMVRTWQTEEYFYSQPYFFNQDKIQRRTSMKTANESPYVVDKEAGSSNVPPTDLIEYVEWHGLIKRQKIYKYLKKEMPPGTNEHDRVWAIVGLAGGTTIVRLELEPLSPNSDADGPNMIIGTCMQGDDNMLGYCVGSKILPMHLGSESVMGMILENLGQSVNAMHVINKSSIVGRTPMLNLPGAVLLTNGDVRQVHKRIEQPPVAKDLFTLLAMFRQMAQDASGLQDTTLGRGDPNAETLGEANMVVMQASLRMRKYLKTIEDTFLIPLWSMRNQVNIDFIDQEYAYGIIGESARQMRTITPGQVRANVDFICEASTRETHKAVMVQQLLKLIQLAPAAIQVGQPVRVDEMLAFLGEIGFSWKQDLIERFFPLVSMQKKGGPNINGMMVRNALMQQLMQGMPQQQGGEPNGGMTPPPPPSENIPSTFTEAEVVKDADAAQQPQIRTA